jgi:TolB-like protein/Tfp pilus assembly protein PilF
VGKELGARYVMEGSLRQAGSVLRLAVQLVDASTGAHLWAESYDRTFRPEAVFELQDELVPRIVSTVADMHGVLPRSMSEAVRGRPPEELSPYEAVLRSFAYFERVTAEELTAARTALESAVRAAPSYGDAWALLSALHVQAYAQGFDLSPDSLTTGLAAARRAVETAPSNHLAHFSLAQALFFQKEIQSFRNAAERAAALNPMDGNSIAFLGELLTYSGDAKRGLELSARAKQLNPHHPGWYWYADFFDAYGRRDYHAALDIARRFNMPGHWGAHVAMTAVCGQLRDCEATQKALQSLLELRPDAARTVRGASAKWFAPEVAEHILDGLRKAGLEIDGDEGPAEASPGRTVSGKLRADEGFWVAVLPFKSAGANPDLRVLADGLSEEIVTGLARFSYLRVIARSSTARLAGEASDVRTIGKELGARYVVEGSLRQAGSTLRVSVQLVDASTGAHLWAESYDRTFSPEAVFELQDELVPRIVSTVADMHGVLPRSMSEAVRSRPPEELSPYQAVLRSFGYTERATAEELADALSCLKLAVQRAPACADAWAMLASMCTQDFGQGFNLEADPLAEGAAAARKAVELAPSNHLAWFGLAQALFFQRELQGLRNAAERAVALNPMDGNSMAFLGEMLTYAGDRERGLELAGRAKQLNPHHPGWYWYVNFIDAYRRRDYRAALGIACKVNLPRHWADPMKVAAAAGQLGERDTAAKALRNLLDVRPDFAARVRKDMQKWWDPELVEHLIDGLRKAGLEIAGANPDRAVSPADSPTASSFGSRPATAVLPFENLSGDPEQEYFADGLAEDLIGRLSLWRAFPVIARNSSFAYKGKAADVKQVAADLGVRYIVEASVSTAGSRVRISAQLVDADTGRHVWARTYDRDLVNLFALQDEISEAIAAALVPDLQRAEYDRARRRAPENLEAWGLYQRALPLIYRFTREDSAQARDLLERATQLDPQFSSAPARLAEVRIWDVVFGWTDSPLETLDAAVAHARRAAELDPRDAEAHAELAFALLTAGFGAEALEAAQRALELNPCLPFALNVHANVRFRNGHPPGESIEVLQRALRLSPHDPTDFAMHESLAGAHFIAARHEEGLAAARRVIAMLPHYYWGYLWGAMNAVGLGRFDEARALVRDACRALPGLTLGAARSALGAMAPEVDRRISEALRQAGLS